MKDLIRNILLSKIFLAISILANCQIQRIDSINGSIREIYNIDSTKRMTGEYKFYYENLLQASGFYNAGLKTGKWIFQSDPSFKIVGHYKDDKKDSIWSYYFEDKIYTLINYYTGEGISYHLNGKIKAKRDSIDHIYRLEEYNTNGQVIKTELTDSSLKHTIEYDENGNIIEEIYFKNDIPYNIPKVSYELNHIVYDGDIKNGHGTLMIKDKDQLTDKYYLREKVEIKESVPNGIYEKYAPDGSILVKGNYLNGYMNDKWEKYDGKSKSIEKELNYCMKDSLKRDTSEHIGFMSGEVFYIVEDMPSFEGESYDKFRNFIQKNLKYPELAAKHNIKGRVYVQFSVDTNGKVVDAKIVRKGVNILLDFEAIRVVNLSPYWRPGFQKGFPVKVQFIFPIVFVLK